MKAVKLKKEAWEVPMEQLKPKQKPKTYEIFRKNAKQNYYLWKAVQMPMNTFKVISDFMSRSSAIRVQKSPGVSITLAEEYQTLREQQPLTTFLKL